MIILLWYLFSLGKFEMTIFLKSHTHIFDKLYWYWNVFCYSFLKKQILSPCPTKSSFRPVCLILRITCIFFCFTEMVKNEMFFISIEKNVRYILIWNCFEHSFITNTTFFDFQLLGSWKFFFRIRVYGEYMDITYRRQNVTHGRLCQDKRSTTPL